MITAELRYQLGKARDIVDTMIPIVRRSERATPEAAAHLDAALVNLSTALNELDAAVAASQPVPPLPLSES